MKIKSDSIHYLYAFEATSFEFWIFLKMSVRIILFLYILMYICSDMITPHICSLLYLLQLLLKLSLPKDLWPYEFEMHFPTQYSLMFFENISLTIPHNVNQHRLIFTKSHINNNYWLLYFCFAYPLTLLAKGEKYPFSSELITKDVSMLWGLCCSANKVRIVTF